MVEINGMYILVGVGAGFAIILLLIISYLLMGRKKYEYRRDDYVQKNSPVPLVEEVVSVKHTQASKKVKAKKELDLPSLDEPTEYEDAKGFNSLKKNKSKTSFGYWKDWYTERKNPATTAIVNMELLNGFHKMFLVKEKEEGFKYRGKKYLFDTEAKYFIIDNKLWAYDYHETFSLPVKRKIPVTDIRKTLESSGVSEVEYATNPATLERFAVSKIAEGIMRGAELDEVFKFLKLIGIITLVVTVIHFLLFAQKSGILASVQIPGVTA